MKIVFYFAVILLHIISAFILSLLKVNFLPVVLILWFGCLTGGLYIKYCVTQPKELVSLGWGMLYGSLSLLIFGLGLIGYLIYMYSH